MKKRLNLLCAIVLLVLGWSVVVTGYYMTRGAVEGFRQGWNYAEAEEKAKETGEPMPEELRVMQHTKYISLLPPMLSGWKGDMLPDSVYNERTHSYIPAAYANLTVSVEAGSPWTRGLLGGQSVDARPAGAARLHRQHLGPGGVHPPGHLHQPFRHIHLAQRPAPALSGRAAGDGLRLRLAVGVD